MKKIFIICLLSMAALLCWYFVLSQEDDLVAIEMSSFSLTPLEGYDYKSNTNYDVYSCQIYFEKDEKEEVIFNIDTIESRIKNAWSTDCCDVVYVRACGSPKKLNNGRWIQFGFIGVVDKKVNSEKITEGLFSPPLESKTVIF